MNEAGAHRLTVLTPEGIEFSFYLAGPLVRFLAWLIDAAVIAAAMIGMNILIRFLGLISADFARAANMLAYFIISIFYGILMEWKFGGQTLGKQLLRLRVLDAHGLQLQFSQVVIRNLLRFVDSLPVFYMVGGLTGLIGSKAQRLGDLAANTIVVANPALPEPDLAQLLQGKYNSFTEYPHLVARLRQRVSAQMARIALTALMRRDSLADGARVEVFKSIAARFKERVVFPPEATEGMSDERYVRNCVDVLYQSQVSSKVALAFGRNSAVKPNS